MTFVLLILFLRAVFLLNDAPVFHADIFSFVSVRHFFENARLVDVDGGARVACVQAVSFVVVHGVPHQDVSAANISALAAFVCCEVF